MKTDYGHVLQGQEGWHYSDEAGLLSKPYQTRNEAYNASVLYATNLTYELNEPYPKPACRYRHRRTQDWYTVIAIANEHCTSLVEPSVVYQGDDGKMWMKKLSQFIAKLEFVVGEQHLHTIANDGKASVRFTDNAGMLSVLEESGADGLFMLGREGFAMQLDTTHVKAMLPYFLYLLSHGRLPDEPLSPSWMNEPCSEDEKVELTRMRSLLAAPEINDYLQGVVTEAAHQVERFGTEHDAGKKATDFIFLVGYLLGEADLARKMDNEQRMRHHMIAAGAVLLNWWRRDLKDSLAPGLATPPTV